MERMSGEKRVVSRVLLVSLALIAAGGLGVVVQAAGGSGYENSKRLLGELTIFDPFTLTSSVYLAESSSTRNVSGAARGSDPDEEPFLRLQSPIRIPLRPKCRSPFRPPWWVPGPPPWKPGQPRRGLRAIRPGTRDSGCVAAVQAGSSVLIAL